MFELSERAKVAIETASPDLKRRIDEVVNDLSGRKGHRPVDRKLHGKTDAWVSRINASVRLVYFVVPEGIIVDDVLDHRRYDK